MIPIVLSTDHNFIMPTGVAVLSMLVSSPGAECDIFILIADDVTNEDQKVLMDLVSKYKSKINFISIGNQFDGAFEIRGITTATYFRLLIPWIIPQYDKVIYFDGDVIFKQNIKELYEFDMGDNYVAGVKPYIYDKSSFENYAPNLGIDACEYINAGVLIMNLKKMRKDGLKEIFLEEAKKKYTFMDQDIINIICKGKIASLPLKWNLTTYNWKLLDDSKIAIIHFAGAKPWKTFIHFWADWWNVYKISPFYDKEFQNLIVERTLNPQYSIRQLFGIFFRQHLHSIYKIIKRI